MSVVHYNMVIVGFSIFASRVFSHSHSTVAGGLDVTSSDGMTADWYPFTVDFLKTVSTRITNTVKEVNRVCYDVTSKPPATVEWE